MSATPSPPKLRWSDLYSEAELYKAAVRLYTRPVFSWRKALAVSTDHRTFYDFARRGLANLDSIHRGLRRETFPATVASLSPGPGETLSLPAQKDSPAAYQVEKGRLVARPWGERIDIPWSSIQAVQLTAPLEIPRDAWVVVENERPSDFAFVPSRPVSEDDHPATALLVVEVADSSLKLDLGVKALLYAECGVPEYWVLDLKARSTVVHRAPRRGKYTSCRRVPWTSVLKSISVPSLSLRLAPILSR